jgi:hypothetical protein
VVRIPFWSDEDRALVVWPLGVALNVKYIAKRLGWLKKQARAASPSPAEAASPPRERTPAERLRDRIEASKYEERT